MPQPAHAVYVQARGDKSQKAAAHVCAASDGPQGSGVIEEERGRRSQAALLHGGGVLQGYVQGLQPILGRLPCQAAPAPHPGVLTQHVLPRMCCHACMLAQFSSLITRMADHAHA